MKKISLLLATLMISLAVLGACALAETKLGQALYPANGNASFCVATVAMEGDVIVAAHIDEFQHMSPDEVIPVPNAEKFTNANGNVLASKRLNNEYYSAGMTRAGATQSIATSYEAIEAFVVGKTIADLEVALEGKDEDNKDMSDVVTSSTLGDTYHYICAIIEAAKSIV